MARNLPLSEKPRFTSQESQEAQREENQTLDAMRLLRTSHFVRNYSKAPVEVQRAFDKQSPLLLQIFTIRRSGKMLDAHRR